MAKRTTQQTLDKLAEVERLRCEQPLASIASILRVVGLPRRTYDYHMGAQRNNATTDSNDRP